MDSDKDQLLLLIKGADNVICEWLLTTEAQEDLRTLTLACRTILGNFHLHCG